MNLYVRKTSAATAALILFVFIYTSIGKLNFFVIDDAWMLLGFDLVVPKSYSLDWVIKVFTEINNFTYSPLITLYFHLIYKINGFDPFYYHLGSLVLQLIDALLIYILSKKILSSFNIENYVQISYLTSVIWLIHPLNVEAVLWIAAVKFGLSNFFLFISFIYYINCVNSNKLKDFFISCLTVICACLCKEQAIFAPYFFIGFALCHIHNWKYDNGRKWILWSAGIIVSTLFFVYINIEANNQVYFAPASAYNMWHRICFACHSLFFYLLKLIFPYPLSFYYTFPVKPNEALPVSFIISPFAFAVFYFMLYWVFKRRKQVRFFFFCSIFFFCNIFFCLQIFPMGVRTNLVATRYMYLPAIPALYLLLSVLPSYLFKRGLIILVAFILLLSLYTYFYAMSWTALNMT